jgi:ubiquinone/menaquinone biosynthesis C-methylase UbiE
MSSHTYSIFDPAQHAAISKSYGLLPAQTTHRVNLLKVSNIEDGDRILEIGCGQGDCTTVLALMYPSSKIDAVDPGSLDYGGPETLGEAQERIKAYEFGERISFHQATPVEFLAEVKENDFDVAVLCHCMWYFKGKSEALAVLKAVRAKVKKLFIAEWGLKSKTPEGQIHLLAALTMGTREARIPHSNANIRSALAPVTIKSLVKEAGFSLSEENWIVPSKTLEDGRWETGMLVRKDKNGESVFLKTAREEINDDNSSNMLETMLEVVNQDIVDVGGLENVMCMDVWTGTFE